MNFHSTFPKKEVSFSIQSPETIRTAIEILNIPVSALGGKRKIVKHTNEYFHLFHLYQFLQNKNFTNI
ncbi:hypothetical protein LEP1GSC034_4501 [Leptospira interrogans str. 2003000735]|uniref:Uncharacterized protein n=5 Tax=Leptospira interrogans TaxID=173 RepID=M7A2E5_LEPIR|nr:MULTISPECIES: hypothetical protein [Leptospira]EMF73227.1 hypothetical protein LEP1GSC148_1872 [Leptospira interrogans serovar Canicola str. LT1962]EMN30487.1 hypothetical protein LEP1GSC083_0528 [Leptospira interrogans serovar Pyrogenes str. L0374]EMP04899.1 hypothetical protein LEP1GSC124_4859 [Leptospira interrogans serovar Pyrogenes str. 200701872]EMY03491.1 hypothetical protein LEP1GSC029_1226 [Leptospira interrogans str. 2002000626]EMY24547.1 hypothetical protein LEP1GSC115_0486 [Lept